jgi:hypothetical protein
VGWFLSLITKKASATLVENDFVIGQKYLLAFPRVPGWPLGLARPGLDHVLDQPTARTTTR